MAIRIINRIIHQRLIKSPQLQNPQTQTVATLSFLVKFNLLIKQSLLILVLVPKIRVNAAVTLFELIRYLTTLKPSHPPMVYVKKQVRQPNYVLCLMAQVKPNQEFRSMIIFTLDLTYFNIPSL